MACSLKEKMKATSERSWAADSLRRILDTAMTASPKETTPEQNEVASAIARELGLMRQADRHKKISNGIKAAFGDQLLEGEELAIWSAFCPSHYREGRAEFADYGFDNIPLKVLTFWKDTKANFAFDSYEVWTTERTMHRDPLLIGAYQGLRYLLARWGAEAADLLPYSEVRERVRASRRDRFKIEELPEMVAKTIRRIEERSPLYGIARRDDKNAGRFFFKKHCGQRLLAFDVRSMPGITGICSGCGGAKMIDVHPPYLD